MLRLALVTVLCWAMLLVPCLVSGAAAAGPDTVRIAELSPEAELAIDKGLQFLASTQRADGSWGDQHRAGITALTLMAFMLKGHFPKKGPYGQHTEKGITFLIQRARDGGGYFGGSMYEHGLATLALSEAWGMSDRPELRDTLKRAVDVILRAQSPTGGWRYQPTPFDHDISVTVMQVVALASAQEAGILVPGEVIQKAMEYVRKCHQRDGGFSYQMGGGQSGFARSAAGCMALTMGGQRNSEMLQSGINYLKKCPDSVFTRTEHYSYGHYYAIQVMYQAGESQYQAWYPKIRDPLLAKQGKDGGWPGDDNGRQYQTAMAILILGVPYRFLPIYQR
jgi:hypothetical protein